MKQDITKLIELLRQLDEQGIGVHEQVAMTEVNGDPILDIHGAQVIQDVILIGDGRVYIERDDNDLEAAALFIEFLDRLSRDLPALIGTLRAETARRK